MMGFSSEHGGRAVMMLRRKVLDPEEGAAAGGQRVLSTLWERLGPLFTPPGEDGGRYFEWGSQPLGLHPKSRPCGCR